MSERAAAVMVALSPSGTGLAGVLAGMGAAIANNSKGSN